MLNLMFLKRFWTFNENHYSSSSASTKIKDTKTTEMNCDTDNDCHNDNYNDEHCDRNNNNNKFVNKFGLQSSSFINSSNKFHLFILLFILLYIAVLIESLFIWQQQITLNEHDQHLMALTTRLLSRTRFNDGIVNNNDKNVKKPTIRSKSSSSSSTTTRRKRELQNIFRWIDDKTIIESLNNRNESELFKHHHHHHHRNQRRRQTSEKQQQHSQQQSKDNGQPAVDFFQQPQPTDQPTIPGFTWLTSYSRIPVNESLIISSIERKFSKSI